MKSFEEAQRLADKDIYLKEDRFESPKEFFKLGYREILKDLPECQSVLDVGCATGEFLYFLTRQLPRIQRVAGIDIVPDFFEIAKKRIPNAQFVVGDIDKRGFPEIGRFDFVALLGVLGANFHPEQVIDNLFSAVSPGGMIYIISNFNQDPVDVHAICRRSGVSEQWETGFNIYSIRTMERLVSKHRGTVEWVDFRLPFSLPKQTDPLRGWTEPFRDNPYTVFYGSSQYTNLRFMKIRAPYR